MPIEKKYSLSKLKALLSEFKRRTTLEYVMISGVNDSEEGARKLSAFANDLSAHVNLLPLHPGAGSGLVGTRIEGINEFAKHLTALGTPVTIRRSRGKDIDAACGQLAVSTGG
jgi:23S rRNA (adenine2503-C2)-methyltransferase